MCPKPSKRRESGEIDDHAAGRQGKAMKSELGKDVKIPNLWRTSAQLEICPKDVKEQMMMKLDEIAVSCENCKSKVVSHTTNKTEQTRGGQKEL